MSQRCCWHDDLISFEDCPYLQPNEEDLLIDRRKRITERCFDCPRFFQDLNHYRQENGPLPELITLAIDEIKNQRFKNHSLRSNLEARNREFQFLHEVSTTIQSSLDLDEIISLALTAITAGQGFGLNRAILLLVDKERQNLKGYVAVGPRRKEDAEHIWREIEESHFSLQEMASRFFEQKIVTEKEVFRELLEQLSVPLSRQDHLFIETLNSSSTRLIHSLWQEPGIERNQTEALEVEEIVLVPLKSRNRRVGLLLADNIINHRPISEVDLASLETFALPVSFAIERASLHEQLQEELGKSREANRRLEEQQSQMVRMEKMALVGKIVSHFAHNVRNPLMIIGGFARSLSKNIGERDEKRRYIESIVRETKKLEEFLREALKYSEDLYPTLDLWDINQLVTTVYGGLQDELNLHQIESHLNLAPRLPLVKIDFKQMSYCLRSILNNSIEAMEKGGRLLISTEHMDHHIRIVVQDTGPGIAAEEITNMTEPFAATPGKTSGLSLPLCSRILKGHKGSLQIQNLPDIGAQYSLVIPLPSSNS